MKNKFTIVSIFLISYLGFLIATLPATLPARLLLNQFEIPKNLGVSGVTGSVWNTHVDQITIGKMSIQKVNIQLDFWSLFTLKPTLSITFGDPFIAGPEGKLELTLSQKTAQISDFNLLIKANEIAQQFTLPLPVSAQGNVEINVVNADINLQKEYQCTVVKGVAAWSKAGVIALEQRIKLGNFTADIDCENGALALIVNPKNNLGLTFSAYVNQGGKVSGKGFLKPSAKFPHVLNNALPFLGRKDSQGRYRLFF